MGWVGNVIGKASHLGTALVLPRVANPRGNLMGEGMGGPARGGRRESWAPPDIGSAHPAERAFTVYRFRPGPARPAAVALPSVRRFPHRPHLRVGPGLKSSPARIAPRLCSRLSPKRLAHGEI